MAAHTQSTAVAASSAALSVSVTITVTASALLAVAGSTFNDTLTISDSKSQGWTRDLSQIQGADAGFCQGHFANAAAGSTTVTLTRASATTGDCSIAVSEFSGTDTAGVQDGTAAANGQAGTGASSSITTALPGTVVISGIATDGPGGTATLTNSFSLGAQGPAPWSSAKMDVAIGYAIESIAGTFSTTWATIGAGNPTVVGIMAFRAIPVPATVPQSAAPMPFPHPPMRTA
jgi:hypothetical protein